MVLGQKIMMISTLIPILMVVEIHGCLFFHHLTMLVVFYSFNNTRIFYLKVATCFPLILPYYEHVCYLCQIKVCVVMVLDHLYVLLLVKWLWQSKRL